MKNLIVVGNVCTNLQMTYDAIKHVADEHKVSSVCFGSRKETLTAVEGQAHLFANHNDIHAFDASINIPKRKAFSLPVSPMNRIFEKSKKWASDNVMLVLHTGDLSSYSRVIKKAVRAKMSVITRHVE